MTKEHKMDPKLREQLFIRKHKSGIITVIVLILILPLLIFFPQSATQYQQKASEIEKTPNISQSAGDAQNNYDTFIKCFDKPNQTPIISGQTNLCSPAQRKAADLNNDGIVNGADYNLFMLKNAGKK